MAYKFNPFTGKLEEYGPVLTGTGTVSAAADGTAATPGIAFANDLNTGIYSPGADQIAISTGGTERARIDSSGRLLVGTSTARSNTGSATSINTSTGTRTPFTQIETNVNSYNNGLSLINNSSLAYAPILNLGISKAESIGSNTSVASGDALGYVHFSGNDGTNFIVGARIVAEVDGSVSTGDLPTRLVFSTTADGASSPTERLRITSAGVLQVADAGNIAVGTTTGTKIGTATTQKLGFYDKTPVVQPTAVADATDAASVITQLNALLSRMRDLGLIAT